MSKTGMLATKENDISVLTEAKSMFLQWIDPAELYDPTPGPAYYVGDDNRPESSCEDAFIAGFVAASRKPEKASLEAIIPKAHVALREIVLGSGQPWMVLTSTRWTQRLNERGFQLSVQWMGRCFAKLEEEFPDCYRSKFSQQGRLWRVTTQP
jgi:hypothetical protein